MRAPAALTLFAALLSPAVPARDEPARLRQARKRAEPAIRARFSAAGVAWPARAVLLRALKLDDALELWAGDRPDAPLKLVHTFRVCARSGGPGPKRRGGDGQVPEGFYEVSGLNPWSSFHLSLRVSYPNRSDRLRGRTGDLGGDIFIHGNCVTIGCLPLEDGPVEELYVAVHDARAAGAKVEVHLFPGRLDEAGLARLQPWAKRDPGLRSFWDELRPAWEAFERTRVAPRIAIARDGSYVVKAR